MPDEVQPHRELTPDEQRILVDYFVQWWRRKYVMPTRYRVLNAAISFTIGVVTVQVALRQHFVPLLISLPVAFLAAVGWIGMAQRAVVWLWHRSHSYKTTRWL